MSQEFFTSDPYRLIRTMQEGSSRLRSLMKLAGQLEQVKADHTALLVGPAWARVLKTVNRLIPWAAGLSYALLIFSDQEKGDPFDHAGVSFGVPIALLVLYFYLRRVIAHAPLSLPRAAEQRAAELAKVAADIRRQSERELAWFSTSCPIPAEFHDPDILDKFIEYLHLGRALSWKDCVNLYYAELQHQERLNSLQRIQSTLNDIEYEQIRARWDRNP